MKTVLMMLVMVSLLGACSAARSGGTGGAASPGRDDLVIVRAGRTNAVVVVSADAGYWEKRAAEDLVKYIEMISGARPAVTSAPDAVVAADAASHPLIFVGQAAIAAEPSLSFRLEQIAKKGPFLRADAIVVRRFGRRVYLAGVNDESHYYAVSKLLHLWGCRWYLPTDLGECVPERPTLVLPPIDHAYAPPFEVRRYWVSWVGSNDGREDFMRRNFMNDEFVPSGHTLGKYVKALVPEGKSAYDIPVADPHTADHVAGQVVEQFGRHEHVMMGMEDGLYTSDYALDVELKAGLFDKYFQTQALADAFMVFYNNLAERLLKVHPNSRAKIGFLAYANLTIPPQRPITAKSPLIAYLAPIDVDPIHGMDDPRSPPRGEYREMMYGWAKVMRGRVVIYDYDQGMLVWRSMPNPSHIAFGQDVKHYRDAGILGVDTECRSAYGTIFTNMYFRGQLLWDPDADVDGLFDEFYPKFYGPAAGPMRRYWSAIYQAWEDTIVTEHEHFVAPAIYTADLVDRLRKQLTVGEAIVELIKARPGGALSRNEKQVIERMAFTRTSFDIIDNYVQMVRAAASEVDYAAAVAAGKRGLAARAQMTDMSGIFTTLKYGDQGWHSFPGEVEQYEHLRQITDGPKGRLIKKLPLEWAFRRDPHDTGLPSNFAGRDADLTYWQDNRRRYRTPASRRDYPITKWEMIRTDLYPQAQGVLHPDFQSFTGYMWTKTQVELNDDQIQGNVHLRFPGLFSEAWLYVNGYLVAYRQQNRVWWYNDYRFEWDVDLTGVLKAGINDITVRTDCPHHWGGLFRRPFLYEKLVNDDSE